MVHGQYTTFIVLYDLNSHSQWASGVPFLPCDGNYAPEKYTLEAMKSVLFSFSCDVYHYDNDEGTPNHLSWTKDIRMLQIFSYGERSERHFVTEEKINKKRMSVRQRTTEQKSSTNKRSAKPTSQKNKMKDEEFESASFISIWWRLLVWRCRLSIYFWFYWEYHSIHHYSLIEWNFVGTFFFSSTFFTWVAVQYYCIWMVLSAREAHSLNNRFI